MSAAPPRRIGAEASEGSEDLSKPGRKRNMTWSITDGDGGAYSKGASVTYKGPGSMLLTHTPFGGFGGSGSLPAAEGCRWLGRGITSGGPAKHQPNKEDDECMP